MNFSKIILTALCLFTFALHSYSQAFITTWQTTDGQITIPTIGAGYNYNLTWTNLVTMATGTLTGQTGNCTITGLNNNQTHRIEITGAFPRIYFNFGGDRLKIRAIEQWGNIVWTSMESAFAGCTNLTYTATDLPNLSGVTNLAFMFANCSNFNGAIGTWNTSSITNMSYMLYACSTFNQPIGAWNTSSVTNMSYMFYQCSVFNQPIGTWNMSSVTNISYMFAFCGTFNQNISTWNTNNITDISYMFFFCGSFNQPIGTWNTGNVINMNSVFAGATAFNQNLSTWNTSNVTNMNQMFYSCGAFNQPIGTWNTSNVTEMNYMFNSATAFNQNLGTWNVAQVSSMTSMLGGCGISRDNYDKTLIGWASQPVQNSVEFEVSQVYCLGEAAHNYLTSTKGWSISDNGVNCTGVFITTWQTTTNGETITIPTTGGGYNYDVSWGDGTSSLNQTGDVSHTYTTAGTYTVKITGAFPRIYFNGSVLLPPYDKIRTIEQWGNIAWASMEGAFAGCTNLTYNATDTPNLSGVTNLSRMFDLCINFNGNLNNWNVSTITNMRFMFRSCIIFNQPLNNWNVGNVTDTIGMFDNCQAFNQNISSWNTSNVTYTAFMFRGAVVFNQPLNSWNMSNVLYTNYMFSYATAFNQPLNNWNTSNVIEMAGMFADATSFNQDISAWNTSQVTNMNSMFLYATSFNQNISGWNTSQVTDMGGMFGGATAFNQNLGAWNVTQVTDMTSMLSNTALSTQNYDNTLIGWAGQAVQNGVFFNADGLKYCNGASARNTLITTKGWSINNDTYRCITNTRGNMITFDGTTSYGSAAYNALLNPSTFTVEAWVQVHSVWANNFRGVISSRENTNGYGYTFYAGSNLNNTWHFWLGYADGSQQINTGVPVVQGAWTHIAASYNGTDLKIYIDGVLVSNTTPVAPPHLNNTQPLIVGAGDNGMNFFTACSVEELRVWASERTLADIRANMHLTLAGNEANLRAYYQFNETTGNAIEGINGLHLSPTGTPTRPTSTVSVGKGVSKITDVQTAGGGIEVDLSTTNFEINLTEASDIPANDVVVTFISAETPYNNLALPTQTINGYWIVRNFGVNTGLVMSYIKVKIPASNTISNADQTTPANLALYKRATNSGASAWTSIGIANNASNTTKEINFPFPTTDSFSEFMVGSSTSPLPITLLGLKGRRVERLNGEMTEEVSLEWTTAQEINNKGFEVEISEDGLAYQKIAFVEGKGTSNSLNIYHVSFINPDAVYVRLKQFDFDGTFSYSPVVFVKGMVGKIETFPNPNKGVFTIKSSLIPTEKIPMQVFNAQGVEIPFTVEGDKMTISGASGVYFLHTTVAGKVNITKIIMER